MAMHECARMSCDQPAVALLTFAPPDAKAWLYDLVDPDPTSGIILCRRHANATVVPMSWQLVDARDPAWPGALGPSADPIDLVEADAAAIKLLEAELPSDRVAIDREFAALRDLPVNPTRYAAPRESVDRADAVPAAVDLRGNGEAPDPSDPSLFELSIGDIPAVTPHPRFR